MKRKFNYEKYIEWRVSHEGLTREQVELIDTFANYKELDGHDYEELWKNGVIVLKEWCNYEKE